MQASDLISIVALCISFAAAYFSYRLGRRTFHVTTYAEATDRTLRMDEVFIQYPLLRPYFSDGEPMPAADSTDRELRNRVLAVAEFVVDILEDCWEKEDYYAGKDRSAWREWIYDVFASSPACCEHYAHNVPWYPTLNRLFKNEGPPPRQVQRVIAELTSP